MEVSKYKQVKDLLGKMLVRDFNRRIASQAIIKHPAFDFERNIPGHYESMYQDNVTLLGSSGRMQAEAMFAACRKSWTPLSPPIGPTNLVRDLLADKLGPTDHNEWGLDY